MDEATQRIQALVDKVFSTPSPRSLTAEAKADMSEGKLGVDPAILDASMQLIQRIKGVHYDMPA